MRGQSVSPPRGGSSWCPSSSARPEHPSRPRRSPTGPGGRRSPSTSSSVRFAHPGLAAGVDVAPPAAAELLEASRRSGTGAAATGRNVEPDVLPTAAGRLADRTRTFTPPAPGDLSTPKQIAAARVAEDDEALRPDGGHGDRRRDRTQTMTRTPGREVGCPRRRGRSPARAEASGSLEGGVVFVPPERPPRPRRCRAGPEV